MRSATATFWHILGPKRMTMVRRVQGEETALAKTVGLATLGVLFWIAAYGIVYRILRYFRGVEDIGQLLAGKLLGLILLTFVGVLLLSNIVTALSTFFLARDLELLISAPSDWLHVYLSKLTETLVHSTWMVALVCFPILAAYGRVYDGGPAYFAVAILSLGPLFVILTAVGSAITLLLVSVFPARRTKDILSVITVAAAGGVVLLIRLLRPEGLARPEGFRNLGEFLALLRQPTSPWLPSEWTTDAIMGVLQGGFDPFTLLLLFATAAGFLVLGAVFHARFYSRAFTRSQEGNRRYGGRHRLGRRLRSLLRPLGISRTQLLLKDVRIFFRDTTQWSQLILLAVLVVVYIYNIRALPLYTEGVSYYFAHLVAFLNMGLAGFVLSAIAARFVLPALSLEGPTLWLLRSSPLRPRDLLWSKYWIGAAPLLFLAVILTVGTNLLLQVETAMLVLSIVTVTAVTFALTAMALAFGAVYPQFDTENTAQIPTSLGGLLFMMSAVALVAGVLVLESWPVLTMFRSQFVGRGLTRSTLMVVALGAVAALTLCLVITIVALRVTLRRIERLEH